MRHRSKRQNLKYIREGQREACEKAVCQHYKSIYRFLAYLSGDASLAEDLTQETFIAAWAHMARYKGRASFGTWLHKIAYHKFIDSGRKHERDAALIAKLRGKSPDVTETSNPLFRIISDEHLCFLYEAMQRLESPEYITIVLHYIQGFSFREMAKVLDESVGTVKWRTSRALKELKTFVTGRI